jgi:hypothetical protein
METINKIVCDLKNELSGETEIPGKSPDRMEYFIGQCTVVLYRMFSWTFCNRIQGLIYYFGAKSGLDRIMHLSRIG